jgi:hypothetical protein
LVHSAVLDTITAVWNKARKQKLKLPKAKNVLAWLTELAKENLRNNRKQIDLGPNDLPVGDEVNDDSPVGDEVKQEVAAKSKDNITRTTHE